MKKILTLMVAAAMALALNLNAQNDTAGKAPAGQRQGQRGPGGPGGNPAQRVERMTKELSLTTDQQTKLTEFFKEQTAKSKALREDTSLTQEQRREKMQALRKETEPKLKAILTTEQYEKYTKLQQEQRGQRGQRGQGGQKPQGEKQAK